MLKCGYQLFLVFILKIRKISKNDAALLPEIHTRCFPDGWNAKSFNEMLSNANFFGFIAADVKEKACGFILCKRIFEEIEVITLCVLPESRRRGIGKSLVAEMINNAPQMLEEKSPAQESSTVIFLEVAQDNIPAFHLYKALGFEKMSVRKKYYRKANSELADAYVMTLKNIKDCHDEKKRSDT
jgi:ribosomal-protein-alanine N-acetyltransferase